MKTTRFLALLGACMLAIAAVNCGGTEEEPPVTRKDGGAPPPRDAGDNNPFEDGGTNNNTDGGTGDAGFQPSAEVTIPEFTNPADTKYVGKRVKFRGVATTERIRTRKETDFCEYTVFMADPRVNAAEHNGVLVTSRSTIKDGNCGGDSQFASDLKVGDEFEIDGLYQENCTYFSGGKCNDVDQAGKDISLPVVRANFQGNVVKLNSGVALPSALPKVVTIDQINSGWVSTGDPATRACSPYQLGTDWWKYRAVLVKVENVEVVNRNPDATKECATHSTSATGFGEYRIAPKDATEPTVRVDDQAFPFVEGAEHRPALNAEFDSIQGVLFFGFGNAKILPRATTDGSPELP